MSFQIQIQVFQVLSNSNVSYTTAFLPSLTPCELILLSQMRVFLNTNFWEIYCKILHYDMMQRGWGVVQW